MARQLGAATGPHARQRQQASWPSIWGLGFRVQGLGFLATLMVITENQVEKKMENDMETGIIWGIQGVYRDYILPKTL